MFKVWLTPINEFKIIEKQGSFKRASTHLITCIVNVLYNILSATNHVKMLLRDGNYEQSLAFFTIIHKDFTIPYVKGTFNDLCQIQLKNALTKDECDKAIFNLQEYKNALTQLDDCTVSIYNAMYPDNPFNSIVSLRENKGIIDARFLEFI